MRRETPIGKDEAGEVVVAVEAEAEAPSLKGVGSLRLPRVQDRETERSGKVEQTPSLVFHPRTPSGGGGRRKRTRNGVRAKSGSERKERNGNERRKRGKRRLKKSSLLGQGTPC